MKLAISVLGCNAPTIRLILGNENGIQTVDAEVGKSYEVSGSFVKIEAGPDNRDLTAAEAEHQAEIDAERAAKDAEADAQAKAVAKSAGVNAAAGTAASKPTA